MFVCLLVLVLFRYLSERKGREIQVFSPEGSIFCTLYKLLCQGLVNLLNGSEGARYPCFTKQIVVARTNPLRPLLE